MVRGVIFDLDGTLLDSLEDIAHAANEVLEDLGHPSIEIPRYRELVGDGVGVLIERILPEAVLDAEIKRLAMKRFEDRYQHHWNKRSKPYEGIDGLLESLGRAGVTMAVLSNKPDAFTKRCVETFFPHVQFSWVLGHSSRFPAKPDPSGARWIGQQMGHSSECIAYVGDTNTDMKTAVGAGFIAMGVSWGFRTTQELLENGARVVFDHPVELQTALLGA